MKTKLPREILTLVNRKSHALGVTYAEQTKQQLLKELDSMRSKGATLNDLEKYIGKTDRRLSLHRHNPLMDINCFVFYVWP